MPPRSAAPFASKLANCLRFRENGLSVKDTSARERALVLSGLFREIQAEAGCLAWLENRAKLQTVQIFFLQKLHCHHAILLQPSI